MSSFVRFILMRHPEHIQGVIGQEGEERIRRAVKELDFVHRFGCVHYTFCTDVPRARRTAEVVLKVLGHQDPQQICEDRNFGFGYLESETEAKHPWRAAEEKIKALQQQGLVTVQDLIDGMWPPALTIRHVLRATMERRAEELNPPIGQIVNVLVGNHGINVLATPTPTKTNGYPPFCSVAVYEYRLDDGQAHLKGFELLTPTP